jgi:hypothetical protein
MKKKNYHQKFINIIFKHKKSKNHRWQNHHQEFISIDFGLELSGLNTLQTEKKGTQTLLINNCCQPIIRATFMNLCWA